MDKLLGILTKSFGTYNIRGIYVEPTYWQAGVIVLLIFLLLFTLARMRYLYVHWNLGHHAFAMFFWGFLFALILEGFLMLGGRTLLTEVIGWENAPKPLSTALDAGRSKLVNVLGVTEEIPDSVASENPSFQSIISAYEVLVPSDKEQVVDFICRP